MNRNANRPLAVLALALMCASFTTRAADAEVGAATARLIGKVEETGTGSTGPVGPIIASSAFAVVVRIDRKLHTWWMAEREADPGKQGSANASR